MKKDILKCIVFTSLVLILFSCSREDDFQNLENSKQGLVNDNVENNQNYCKTLMKSAILEKPIKELSLK